MVGPTLTVLATFGFLALLVIALRRHRRDRQPGALALAQVLGVYLGAGALTAVRMVPEVHPGLDAAALVALVVAFTAIPLLMLRFANVFDQGPRWMWPVAVAVWLPLAAGLALLTLEVLPEPTGEVFLWLLLLAWAGGHALVAASMLRGGRRAAAIVARRRSQLMAAAVGGLGAVLPLALLVDRLPVETDTGTGLLLLAVVCVGLLLLGFAPPSALRWHWARRDRHELARAQRRMVEIDDPDQLAAELLPHVMQQVGAQGAWLLDGSEVVAAIPPDTAPPWRGFDDGRPPVHRVEVRGTPHGHVLLAPTVRGHLVLSVDPYALLFGARDLDVVGALAVQLDVALDRARLKMRELTTVRDVEQARRITDVERVRDDVLTTVSHEMRTPLTTVCGATSLLLQRWEEMDEASRHGMVVRVAANAEDLRTAVEQVLELTAHRLAAPEQPSLRSVEVGGLLRRTVRDLSELLAGHEVLVVAPDDVVAVLDVAATEQMLRQLLTNAAKFSPPNSPVELEARVVGDDLLLTVSDRGTGMEPEDVDQACEPFYRAGDVLRRETRGLGLGLTVVSTLARSVGASLEVDSQPGRGTTMTLRCTGAVPGVVAAPERDTAPADPS